MSVVVCFVGGIVKKVPHVNAKKLKSENSQSQGVALVAALNYQNHMRVYPTLLMCCSNKAI